MIQAVSCPRNTKVDSLVTHETKPTAVLKPSNLRKSTIHIFMRHVFHPRGDDGSVRDHNCGCDKCYTSQMMTWDKGRNEMISASSYV